MTISVSWKPFSNPTVLHYGQFGFGKNTPYCQKPVTRPASDCGAKKAVVVGAYDDCNPGELKLTAAAEKINEATCGKLMELLKGSGLKKGKALAFSNLGDYGDVAVAGLGDPGIGYDEIESMDVCKENIRVAAGAGARLLQDRGINEIAVEGFTNPEPAAEGAILGVWKYEQYRTNKTKPPKIELFDHPNQQAWQRGAIKAKLQNIARELEDAPANLMTPTLFAQWAIELLCPCGIHVDIHDREWIQAKQMWPFLTVARSSCEPPLFMECTYCGIDDVKPVIITGKGVTYDSGGLNVKNCLKEDMTEYRADMAGAAVAIATIKGAAEMNLPIQLRVLIPLCESMVGGLSMKPGDVVMGMNGKTIRIENTDNEGRLILADAIAFAGKLKPCLLLNIADFTTGIKQVMGDAATATFVTTDDLWEEIKRASAETGDRVWRFPLWKHYHAKVTEYVGVDVNNVGKGKGAEPCLGAAFLMEFIPPCDFAHFDISGSGLKSEGISQPYLRKGLMSGRPTRLLIQLLYQIACPHRTVADCPCEIKKC